MNKLYFARRRRNQIAMGLSLAATVLGLGWLVFIWTASVLSLGLVALALRMLMATAGMTA